MASRQPASSPGAYVVQRELQATSFSIRSVDLERDLPDVWRIFEKGMRLYCDPLPQGSVVKRSWEHYIKQALADDLARIEEIYLKPGGNFWVLVDHRSGDQVVGCVGVEKLDDSTCELRRMSVAPGTRKAGLGLKLCRQVEEFAALQGFKTIVLGTGSIMV